MNRCERCGQAVPDGLPVCPECLKLAGAGEAEVSAAEELRDIAAILRIEAGTDANIKEALQGILNIAARLERSVSDGKKEEKAAAQQSGGGAVAQTEARRQGAE